MTGLGRRIALHLVRVLGGRTLGLGYALTLADLALAPFTASAAARAAPARSTGRPPHPELYDSRPDDGTARRLGSYLLYTACAASFVTSSMFLTALAPNVAGRLDHPADHRPDHLVARLVRRLRAGWLRAAGDPAAAALRHLPAGDQGAGRTAMGRVDQLASMGPMSRNEWVLLALILGALGMWWERRTTSSRWSRR